MVGGGWAAKFAQGKNCNGAISLDGFSPNAENDNAAVTFCPAQNTRALLVRLVRAALAGRDFVDSMSVGNLYLYGCSSLVRENAKINSVRRSRRAKKKPAAIQAVNSRWRRSCRGGLRQGQSAYDLWQR